MSNTQSIPTITGDGSPNPFLSLAQKIASSILTVHNSTGSDECQRAQLMLKRPDGSEKNMGGRCRDSIARCILDELMSASEVQTTDHPMSVELDKARSAIYTVRADLNRAARRHGHKERVDDLLGLLTCGLVTLAYHKEKIQMGEIADTTLDRGQHLKFIPRGIGLDVCPSCFVCGAELRSALSDSPYLHNIAAFVDSSAGDQIIGWFDGRARLDVRPNEPGHTQLKVGACHQHLPNLETLERVTRVHGVIRLLDITEAKNSRFASLPTPEDRP